MPSKLIQKLRSLMDQNFGAEEPARETLLGINGPVLSDELLELVDEIAEVAKNVFGTKLEPSSTQQNVLHTCGFSITCGARDAVGWTMGLIQTPRGIIAYS